MGTGITSEEEGVEGLNSTIEVDGVLCSASTAFK